jgi:thiosulfate/3-mercaptopyruvate sulfurtransferase
MSNTPVITVAELATMIANGDKIVVADCRFDPFAPEAGPAAYVQGHIRGAHYLHLDNDLAGPSGETGGGHPVPSPEDFTTLMRGIGVDDDSLLVAYDGGGLATASRLWWLARYFGHANVVVLNGGMSAWQAAGQPLDPEPAAAGKGNFTARPDQTMRIDYEDLCDPDKRPLLIDARDPSRYAGTSEPGDVPAGHIPGSINKFYQEVLGADGLLRDAEALRGYWSWLEENEEAPVVSCGSGITACVNLLSLEMAGVKGARLYPGSWSDWCQRGGEVATGADPNQR